MINDGLTGATLVRPPGVPHTRIVGLGNCTRPAKQRPEILIEKLLETLSDVYFIPIDRTQISDAFTNPPTAPNSHRQISDVQFKEAIFNIL